MLCSTLPILLQLHKPYLKNKKIVQQKISEIIKRYRLEQHKSISLISNEIGMTKSMWADLEKAIKDPQLTTLLRIAEGLEVPLSRIIIELENTLGREFSLIS
ncbi:helix-turn-helix transcriptional regulator [bacterium]|nr:helix-turn-helix transcriptional regulator [bacterium]